MVYCTTSILELPSFIADNAENAIIWFYTCESLFHTYDITSNLEKFNLTVGSLKEMKITKKIREIIGNEFRGANKYLQLKTKIIESFAKEPSSDANIIEPSNLLGQLCKSNNKKFEVMPESNLRTQWINQLSPQLRDILKFLDKQNLYHVSLIADKIHEYHSIKDNTIAILEKTCLELRRELKVKNDLVEQLSMQSQNLATAPVELAKKDDNRIEINNTDPDDASDLPTYTVHTTTNVNCNSFRKVHDRSRSPLSRNFKDRDSSPHRARKYDSSLSFK